MNDTLTNADLENVLRRFGAAIERDQLRVDAMPPANLQPPYNDEMWRQWRRDHIRYVNVLISTAIAVPTRMSSELTVIAASYEPKGISTLILELLSEVVSGSYEWEEFASARCFFGTLIKQIGEQSKATSHQDAHVSLARWFPLTDPLRIADDPECQYGRPAILTLLIGTGS
ncbi:hypothetical protein [Bradyrhizobium sp.]|jgi:hypothetical protein|uniref:hypothetical protein n=1 Tax=Bradyrhizobium sp. TaxID=376 RepID=UPI003C1893D5